MHTIGEIIQSLGKHSKMSAMSFGSVILGHKKSPA